MKTIPTRSGLSALLFLLAVGCTWLEGGRPGQEVRRFESPDGRYAVVVRLDLKADAPITPGSSGDRPGFVQLIDKRDKILRQKPVDMVGRVDQVFWEKNEVVVKMVATWKLKPN